MRLILRTVVVLALTGAHIQRAFGQQPSSNPVRQPQPTATITPPAVPPSTGQPRTSPDPVGGMAYAFDGQYLFILGGQANDNYVSQFFTLDLGVSWSADRPEWTLRTHPKEVRALAGGLFPDNKFLAATTNGQHFQIFVNNALDAQETAWSLQFQTNTFVNSSGLFVATNPDPSYKTVYLFDKSGNKFHLWTPSTSPLLSDNSTTSFSVDANGSIWYVVGGTTTASGRMSSEVWSFDLNTQTWTRLGDFATGRTGMACAVQENTLVIWGGFTDPSSPADSKPLLFNVVTKQWLNNFTAPTRFAVNPTNSDGLKPTNESDRNEKKDESANLGAIIGGVVGGLAVVALMVGFFIVRRRRTRNMKYGIQVLPRGAPPPPSSSGKSASGQVNVPMNEYTTIRSPFVADDSTSYQGSTGAPPLYGAPALQPVSAPLLNQNQNQSQSKNGSMLSQPVQPYSMPFQVPPIPVRPLSGSPKALTIQSPFDVETQSSAHHPLLPGSSTGPVSSSIGGGGIYPASAPGGALSPSMDAASVDLIPCEASEAGDHDHSRSNSIVLSRAGPPVQSGSLSGPVRGKNASQGPSQSHSHNHSNSQGNDKAELVEDGADGRRDSTETLEYLEIS
ncbi:hypothetical protein BG015_009803 [Linnemannia schmuckeri]|uniref:Kelch repeat-containing protein n=1 Tax=Linnemannia schmuckeri TaxID=64567 RepID=A0A9P5RVE9_9FUNG|nr:hypothetical protein BG015_009803 [Linnemannia schmuckeri]